MAPRNTGALAAELTRRLRGEVRFDRGSRALYATDASNYRQLPIGVVIPRDVDDAVAAIGICREHDAPVLSRGGGTSLAGECCNEAVVLDWSKYCDRVESVDVENRRAVCQPGVVLDELNRITRRGGLVFGPKPSTHGQCTIGGMIGNNSCGSTAQWAGTTADNVRALEILTYDGTRMWVGRTSEDEYANQLAAGGRRAEIYRGARDLRDRYADAIRTRFPDIPRLVSGFNLDALLPESGFDLAKALVGTESTCVTVLRAELDLVPEPASVVMVLLAYPDIASAGDAVPQINTHAPMVLEGMDEKLVGFMRRKHLHPEAVQLLPRDGRAWLIVEFGGDTMDEARAAAGKLVDDLTGDDSRWPKAEVFDDDEHREQIWQVRESGLGATARVPGMPDTWPGWEDSAVPPDRLGDYLRDLTALQEEFGYQQSSLYGHFGHGCVHSRMPFDLTTADGIRAFRAFVERAADLVVSYGGSLSGEHGDGQARGELLPRMFGEELTRAFGEFKAVFDPDDRMNPGKVVHARPLDGDLRLGADYEPAEPPTEFTYPHDEGSLAHATLRCVGVGKCRQSEGGVMCPSYMVTKEEKHSTRGRARLLNEMMSGRTITDGWRSEEVHDALDLCLACKGCKTDCPVNVDMATYKAEFLSHHFEGRLRPREHYSLGWLPLWARLAAFAPGAVNAVAHTRLTSTVVKRIGGIDPWRDLPRFAPLRFTDWYRRRGPRGSGKRGTVLLWPDTFTNSFQPEIAVDALTVLEAAGFRVEIPTGTLCCGLTWISTGQLRIARSVLRRTVAALAPQVRAGLPVVVLEPSCASVFRGDARELLGYDLDVERLRKQSRTLADLLADRAPEFAPSAWTDEPVSAKVQVHCHQHAVIGYDAERDLLERAGVDAEVLDSGCCGLAGDFGMTMAHRDVSMACAERVLLPAVRDAGPASLVIADGFSCRTQIKQGRTGRTAVHSAQVLASAVRGTRLTEKPERVLRLRAHQEETEAR